MPRKAPLIVAVEVDAVGRFDCRAEFAMCTHEVGEEHLVVRVVHIRKGRIGMCDPMTLSSVCPLS